MRCSQLALEAAQLTVQGKEAGGVSVAHGDAALVRSIEPCQEAQERRLAGAVGADEPDPLAVSEDERDVREERERVVRSGHTVAFQHRPSYLSHPIVAGVRPGDAL